MKRSLNWNVEKQWKQRWKRRANLKLKPKQNTRPETKRKIRKECRQKKEALARTDRRRQKQQEIHRKITGIRIME